MSRFTPDEQLDRWTAHHPPRTPATVEGHEKIRAAARAMLAVYQEVIPEGPDKTAALRAVVQAMWAGNAALACNQEVPAP